MERLRLPNDEFRARLTRADIERICAAHNLSPPVEILPERGGNNKVAYHLDGRHFLAFVLGGDMRAELERIAILTRLGWMPLPRIVAWAEQDPVLAAPYYIQEECPGVRLDRLWEQSGPAERVGLLEGLGAGMACYHTIGVQELRRARNELGLRHVAPHLDQPPLIYDECETLCRRLRNLRPLADRLQSLGVEAHAAMDAVEKLYKARIRRPPAARFAPGLVHEEPFEEHFFIARKADGYHLVGCVDIEGLLVADGIHDVGAMYMSMLNLAPEYYAAFRRGYEQFFPFPPDAPEQLRFHAITQEILCLSLMVGHTADLEREFEWPRTPVAEWVLRWVRNRFWRLQVWLDETQRPARALFRPDVGPW